MNAIPHAVEALYAEERNPIISLMAQAAIAALARALPAIITRRRTVPRVARRCTGACLCGVALGSVGMALHHKLCHVLGGSFDLPHAPTHTVILPHAVAYNAPGAPEAMARIARALGTQDAATGLYELAQRLGAPSALSAIGMEEADLERAVTLAAARPYPNPRPLEVSPFAVCSTMPSSAAGPSRRPRDGRDHPQLHRGQCDGSRAAAQRGLLGCATAGNHVGAYTRMCMPWCGSFA